MAKSIETQNTENSTQNAELKTKAKVPIPMLVLGWAAMLIFTFHACTHMVAAGDTWVAMACGRHFVEHGVNTVEPFSANSHPAGPTQQEVENWPGWAQKITKVVGLETVKKWHPTGWIDQNWLTHVIFYKLVPQSSYADGLSFTSNALVYWKFAIYIITVICLYYTSRLLGVHPALAAVFCSFALFTGRSFLDIRPAGFSNMLVAVMLLILALVTYRNYLYIWLIVPLTVFWCNVHGGYIYLFIMLVPFIGLHLLICCNKKWTAILYNLAAWPLLILVMALAGPTLSTLAFAIFIIILDVVLIIYKSSLISIGWKGVYHSIAAYITAFIAMIIFNPFHLTNLTHTFEISISKHAAQWREIHEWQAAFQWSNPVGTAVPFLIMFILGWIVLAVWIFILFYSSRTLQQNRKTRAKSFEELGLHKIDLAAIIIAALTIYMAIRSRRFIPIAAIAGCPVIAMLINEIVRRISATINFRKEKGFVVSDIPQWLMSYFMLSGTLAVVFFGTLWGLKFKKIYLDPWPSDAKYSSVFMRMTASDAKPFYAMKFIKDNKLSGKMFNYWTEGGFIAWGQMPDPNTGKTPLQLFMDGRAQAAYNRDIFDLWKNIMAGGDITRVKYYSMLSRKEDMSNDDLKQIGKWMSKELTDRNVWAVLMPSAVFNDPDKTPQYYAINGLERDPDWPTVFFDDEQKIYVNIKTAAGRKLFEGIANGTTLYPDDFHTYLNQAHHWFYYIANAEHFRKGLDLAIKAFDASSSRAPLYEMIVVSMNHPEYAPAVETKCREYLENFSKNKAEWRKLDGYRRKAEAAHLASAHLEQIYSQKQRPTKEDSAFLNFCVTTRNACIDELVNMSNTLKW
jgi:hypothetical protein